jgi:DNA-binding winged helix-turn-helix (wHTH) protein
MAMSQVNTEAAGYRFDDFYLDAANRRLLRGQEVVALNSRYFDVLLLLVSQSGRLVEKQRIFDEVWDGVFVTDSALTQCIKDIRRQLGDDAARPRYIKTVPKHGYIFIGDLAESLTPSLAHADPSDGGATISRPYKFLDYFTEQDAGLFFGREAEVQSICSQVLSRRSFILHGRSGVGKSSIIRAGLCPRLKSEGHHVFVIRSFTDPLHQMTAELAASLACEPGPDTDHLDSLIERACELSSGRQVIFFLDQFEEFFTLLSEDVRARFIAAASRLVADRSLQLRLVFVLREDLLAEMSLLKQAIPEIFHHEYRLKRLSRAGAACAITGPAESVGCRYEPELVERLLDDLSEGEVIDPPQLQIVCDYLFDSRDSSGALTLSAYQKLGTASQIIAGYLERVLRRFRAASLHRAQAILTALISADGQRLVLRESELYARIASPEVGRELDIARLVEELVEARVVRRRSQDGEAWVELAHDFLTPEINRWLTLDEVALKQARGVIERAMENFRSHSLVIDADALDLLLPFGEQLGLTDAEADLLATSLLNRARPVPEWLASRSRRLPDSILEAIEHEDKDVRLSAIAGCLLLRDERMREMLRDVALWDGDLMVRKSASIALADWLGIGAEAILSQEAGARRAGLVRRAISLAMVRDYDKRLVRFSHLPVVISTLVFLGLMWVRVRRGGQEIIRQAMGGTLGGAASGMAGGLMLGVGLSAARHAPALDATSMALVLVSLGAFIGAVGGFSVSLGMSTASLIAYRHSRWWSVVGGTLGGAAVGGSTKLLGVDTLRALFGQNPTGITGALEGAIIGAGVSLGAVLTARLIKRSRPWQKILGASLGAMCAGILLTVIGGNLFSGSLEIVARSFADSQMRMDPIAPFFGEVHFGRTTQIVLGAIEGLLFGAGMTGGLELAARARPDKGTDPA